MSNSERTIEEKIKDFTKLLEQIDNLSDKKRQLWREIYENAITDRANANIMFMQLVSIVGDKSTEHAVHGRSIATYIERMSKANDQLIKLADLIAQADKPVFDEEVLSADDLFDRISSKK